MVYNTLYTQGGAKELCVCVCICVEWEGLFCLPYLVCVDIGILGAAVSASDLRTCLGYT